MFFTKPPLLGLGTSKVALIGVGNNTCRILLLLLLHLQLLVLLIVMISIIQILLVVMIWILKTAAYTIYYIMIYYSTVQQMTVYDSHCWPVSKAI